MSDMRAFRAEAQLRGGAISFRDYIHLDALLAYAVCVRDDLPIAPTEGDLVDVEIPIQREPEGRFHLCSVGICDWEIRERAHMIRRFPVEHAAYHTDIKRVNLSAGAQKHFRFPYERGFLVGDSMAFYGVGKLDEVRELLALVHYLGGKRSTGHGRIRRWVIEPCDGWEGFPVLSPEGVPLRHLPDDWPGLAPSERRFGNLSYPYWRRSTEELVACPARC